MPEHVRVRRKIIPKKKIPSLERSPPAIQSFWMAERRDAVYVQLGEKDVPGAHCVRIVHISDTHTKHNEFRHLIPDGDILVHSGDFDNYSIMWNLRPQAEISRLQTFFASLPHEHKIFVAGNHDMKLCDFVSKNSAQELQARLSSCEYLQDSAVTIRGITFYGTPWTPLRPNSRARGFSRPWSSLSEVWKKIPANVDILITHIPPWEELASEIETRIKPKACLHGHIHHSNGVSWINDTLVSNAAMASIPRPVIIDYYTTKAEAMPQTPNRRELSEARRKQYEAQHKQSCVVL